MHLLWSNLSSTQYFQYRSESAAAIGSIDLQQLSAKSFIYQPPIMLFRRESSHSGESSHLLQDLAKTSRHQQYSSHFTFSTTLKYSGIIPKSNTQSFLLLKIFKLIVRIYMLIDILIVFHFACLKVNKRPPKNYSYLH